MAFGNITVNDGIAARTYNFIKENDSRAQYRDLTSSTLALPHVLEISHQEGSTTKPDRHLVRFARTDTNTTGDKIDTGSVHVVIAAPRSVVELSTVEAMISEIVDFLSEPANVDAILAGGYPA